MKAYVCALLCACALVVSCGSDDPVEPANQPPTITFNESAIAFNKVGVHELNVNVSDPDVDDVLTTTWEITGSGSLTQTSTTTANWQAPLTTGPDTLRVTVTDGEFSDSIEEIIFSGTPLYALTGVLTTSNSPFIIPFDADLNVPVDVGTVIEAGVEILFGRPGGLFFIDSGRSLTIQGTANEMVVIRPNDRNLRCQDGRGWWEGIQVQIGGNLTVDYADITYGVRNIAVLGTGNATITNSEIKCGEEAGIYMGGTGNLTVSGCEISNNKSVGVKLESGTSAPNSVQITDNYILINGNTGIWMSVRDALQTSNILVHHNRIEFNFTHGIYLIHQSFPVIRLNHFEANGLSSGLSAIRLNDPYPDGVPFDTLTADSNYWGGKFTSSAQIDALIHDSLDDARIGTRIDVEPWLDTSPFDTLVTN